MFELTKDFKFEASHQLIGHDGKCARLHGHSWRGTLIIQGERLYNEGPKSGMLVDYGDISSAINPLVERYLDHWHLNETLYTDRPTSEFIAKWVYDKLKPGLPLLRAVTIMETCTCSCTFEETIYIYTLSDSATGEIRYVGKTVDPEKRYRQHLNAGKRGARQEVCKWVSGLIAQGREPRMNVIEEIGALGWEEREMHWIEKLRLEGKNLTNVQDGGNCTNGFRGKNHTDESKAKTSASLKGREFSAEHRQKLKDAHARHRAARPQKQPKAKKGSQEHITKVAAAHRGMKRSEETKAKLRAAWVRRKAAK